MGKALIIPNVSFATDNLGQITFLDGKLRSITIVGSDSISGVSTYTVSYYPQNTEYTGVEWTVLSGNATIGLDTGVLTPSSDGTVVIQALSTYDRSIVATKTISVSIVLPLTSISIYGSDSINSASTYSVIYNPLNTTQTGVTWSVLSGPATITQAGLLTPSGSGTVVIEATSTYNAQVVATKTITVSMEIPVESISIVGDSLISGQSTYTIAYNPSNTTQQGVTWSVVSGNATITQQGVLTASDSGEVVIQAESTYNPLIKDTKTITVETNVPLVSLSIVGDSTIDGDTLYSIEYNPQNASQTGVVWSVVSGSNIATINQSGMLEVSGTGTVVIQAQYIYDSNKYATKTITVTEHNYSQDYFTIKSMDNGNEISVYNCDANTIPSLSYSTDNGSTWESLTVAANSTTNVVTIDSGDTVMFKGVNSTLATNYTAYNGFKGSKTYKVSGNIMSLLNGDNFTNNTEFANNSTYNFAELFINESNLVDARNLVLPATICMEHCYDGMLRGTSITVPPNLPAMTLAAGCYSSMFESCIDLEEAPELPATTQAGECYQRMFCMNRSSKITSPKLTKSPIIHLTDISDNACRYMFMGNGNLVEITCLATHVAQYGCAQWVKNVSSNGTFKKNPNYTWRTGVDGIPNGWTVEDYVEPSNNE